MRTLHLAVITLALSSVLNAAPLTQKDLQGWLNVQATLSKHPEKWTMSKWKSYWQEEATKPVTSDMLKQFAKDMEIVTPDLGRPAKKEKFLGIKVRQSYTDVVSESAEDPLGEGAVKKRSQVKGATASYSRNFNNDGESWSVNGALVRPFSLYRRTEGLSSKDGWYLDEFAAVPSISLKKSTDNKNPNADTDSLTGRLGLLYRLSAMGINSFGDLELRANAAYSTDTRFKSSIVAGEFDLEPRIAGRRQFAERALGFDATLMKNEKKLLSYNLRAYLHGEFGTVDDTGGNAEIKKGDFFRMGPVASLTLTPHGFSRALGMDEDAVSISAAYSYIPSVSGVDNGHDSHFKATLDWAVWKDPDDEAHRISLQASYEKGGLEFTKEEVDLFTLGLGVSF